MDHYPKLITNYLMRLGNHRSSLLALRGQLIPPTDRIRHAKPSRHHQCPAHTLIQGKTKTNGHKNRFHSASRAQDLTNQLPSINQICGKSASFPWITVFTTQTRLSNSHCTLSEPKPKMRGNPQTSWMGSSIPIHEDEIGVFRKLNKPEI